MNTELLDHPLHTNLQKNEVTLVQQDACYEKIRAQLLHSIPQSSMEEHSNNSFNEF